MGRGGGFGRGRGHRNMYWATGMPAWARSGYGPIDPGAYPFPEAALSPKQEANALKHQVKHMEDSMNALNERIKELENAPSESEE
jgi:hypothetical protein